MQAPEGSRPAFSSPDWLYEVKFDGYRTLAAFGGGQPVQLRTKSGADCTKWYPEVCEVLAKIPGGPYVVDGEAAVLDDLGRSDFERLHARARRRRWVAGAPVTLCAFDLLVDNGENVMGLPLAERKERLARVLRNVPQTSVLLVLDLPAEARLFQEFVLGLELEGFMAKKRVSTYQQGTRSADWLKIKRPGAVPPQRFERRRTK
ncbi:ATP-dependent DNA ligase [Ramlibacter alkalitolerans]|uniref:ATP-dependent DNA ligase family profile domain-containing protein n=1 Tax=Ramlibacter alkalitolerans TaxID=2039631 RepID=A0ABS1JV27_9BURK|nr:hypothetical protein [Ramlibacter alkalitolerans]MBL0427726.1 hypothetical protein [Ramlibacter alkalitolerans]